jgi:hypothetical protein
VLKIEVQQPSWTLHANSKYLMSSIKYNSSFVFIIIHHFIIGRSGKCFSYRFLFAFEISIIYLALGPIVCPQLLALGMAST